MSFTNINLSLLSGIYQYMHQVMSSPGDANAVLEYLSLAKRQFMQV